MHEPDALLVHKPEAFHLCSVPVVWGSYLGEPLVGIALYVELSYIPEQH